MKIVKTYGDGIMIITPADHYIKDVPSLVNVFRNGYIKTAGGENETMNGGGIRQVLEFREKPDEDTARGYLQQGNYLWNSGMFVWKAGLILDKLKEYVPDVYADLEKIGSSMNTPGEQEVLHNVYPGIRNISIDYAVMEPSAAHNDVLVIPGDFGWSDIGSWDMMEVLHERDENGNIAIGNALLMDTRNSIVHSGKKQVVVLGADNLVVVDVADALLVCDVSKAQSIRQVVDRLREEGKIELL